MNSPIIQTTLVNSPWGEIQSQHELAPGIIIVSTARHGGIWLSPERRAALPPVLAAAPTYCRDPQWFEEDIDAILPVLAFASEMAPQAVWNAVRMAESYDRQTDSQTYPLTLACRMFLRDNSCDAAVTAKEIALAWEMEYSPSSRWERGSLSGSPSIPGWSVDLTRHGKTKTVQFKDYPVQQFYTDAEVEANTLRLPEPAPLPPCCASCADLPPHVTFDGEPSFSQPQDLGYDYAPGEPLNGGRPEAA